jgi:hypothetical protein
VVQPDVAELMPEDELQTFAIVVVEIREQFVGEHDIVVPRRLRRERVQRAVAIGQVDLRTAAKL